MAEKRLATGMLNRAIPILFDNPKNVFLTTSVRKFLFDGINIACDKKGNGITKLVCKQIRQNAPAQLKVPDEGKDGPFVFSLLSYVCNVYT